MKKEMKDKKIYLRPEMKSLDVQLQGLMDISQPIDGDEPTGPGKAPEYSVFEEEEYEG